MKFQRVLFLIFTFFTISFSHASHIVGGEITLAHSFGKTYTVTLNLYFDVLNGDPAAQDERLLIGLFDKASNKLLDSVFLNLSSTKEIPTEKGVCGFIKLQMRQLTYTKQLILDSAKYNGSGGFYAAWERCCRNGATFNIQNPNSAATVFYSEFAPIATKNSSPVFRTPTKNSFACVGVPATYDFSATDKDGDLLTYELAVPLNGYFNETKVYGLPNPAPYSPINFIEGLSISNMIPGNPSLRINQNTGELSFTATMAGIYVFSIKCSSFKNGVLNGTVTRDFQLSVIRCNSPNTKPKLQIVDNDTKKLYKYPDSLKITNNNNCISIQAIDSVQGQRLAIQRSGNFNFNNMTISPNFYITKFKHDTATFRVCFDNCAKSMTNSKLDFRLTNENNCALPNSDVLSILIKNIKPKLTNTEIKISLPNPNPTVVVGRTLNFDVEAVNNSADYLNLYSRGNDFNLSERKMTFNQVAGITTAKSNFTYSPTCEDLDFSNLKIFLIANSFNCDKFINDTLPIQIAVVDTLMNYEFPLTNVITPNNDGINDKFELANLPADNCSEKYSGIEIYNRWGVLVYMSEERAFSWDANNVTDGLYYYAVKYNKQKLRSWLQIVR